MNEWEVPLVLSLIHSLHLVMANLPNLSREIPYWDPRLFYGEERVLSTASITSLLSKQQDSDRIDLENRTLGVHIFEMSRVDLVGSRCDSEVLVYKLFPKPYAWHSAIRNSPYWFKLKRLFYLHTTLHHSPNWGFCLQWSILTDRVGSLPLYDPSQSNNDVLWRVYSAVEHNLYQRNNVRDKGPRNLRSRIMRTHFSSKTFSLSLVSSGTDSASSLINIKLHCSRTTIALVPHAFLDLCHSCIRGRVYDPYPWTWVTLLLLQARECGGNDALWLLRLDHNVMYSCLTLLGHLLWEPIYHVVRKLKQPMERNHDSQPTAAAQLPASTQYQLASHVRESYWKSILVW